MAYNKMGYEIRAENIKAMTALYYEPENQSKCYRQVWRSHIYPHWGIGYKSFLNYIHYDKDSDSRKRNNREDKRQLKIFD
ncbi:MAG: hypothetical protein LBS25_00695 [Candidatus Symbiothrix sp.]|jgi:hypothetical protein|nr:hypothetical protein [Candidatus Symbiothrix sp.]